MSTKRPCKVVYMLEGFTVFILSKDISTIKSSMRSRGKISFFELPLFNSLVKNGKKTRTKRIESVKIVYLAIWNWDIYFKYAITTFCFNVLTVRTSIIISLCMYPLSLFMHQSWTYFQQFHQILFATIFTFTIFTFVEWKLFTHNKQYNDSCVSWEVIGFGTQEVAFQHAVKFNFFEYTIHTNFIDCNSYSLPYKIEKYKA